MTSCGRRVPQAAGQAPGTQSWRWTGLEAQGLTLGLGSTGGPEGALSGGQPGGCSAGSPLVPGRPVGRAAERSLSQGLLHPAAEEGGLPGLFLPHNRHPRGDPVGFTSLAHDDSRAQPTAAGAGLVPPTPPSPLPACTGGTGHRCGPGSGEAVPGSHPAQPGRPPRTRHCAHHPQDRGGLERVQGALGGWGVALALDGRRGGARPPRQSKGAGRLGAISAQDARSLP